ncbi:MAG TPA: hypothetical protein VMA97_13435 [Streptosporangiaceae bacterium]|nr:hypothetical protein [Streptosporangiaceae bacterium]
MGTPDRVPALGAPSWPWPGLQVPPRLLRADRVFPDGSAELSYAPGEPGRGP